MRCTIRGQNLVEDAGLVSWYHIFYVYKCILSAMPFKCFECFLYEVSNVLPLLLTIINPVARVN